MLMAGGKQHVTREVEALKAMGALITKEADSMSAMNFSNEQGGQSLVDGHPVKRRNPGGMKVEK